MTKLHCVVAERKTDLTEREIGFGLPSGERYFSMLFAF